MVQIHGGLGSQPYRSLNKLPVHFMLTMGVFLLSPQHDLGHLSNHVDSETYTSSSSQFLVSMMVSYAIFCKSKGTSKTSNLIEGAIVTNHHVCHIGTFAPSSSFSVLHPQHWLICQQDSHLS